MPEFEIHEANVTRSQSAQDAVNGALQLAAEASWVAEDKLSEVLWFCLKTDGQASLQLHSKLGKQKLLQVLTELFEDPNVR